MATAHRQRIETEARCRWPQPRVVYINNETSKMYSPRATVLHRCDESTGCCADFKTCTVKTDVQVSLAFWERSHYRNRPVLLLLSNHTECHCVNLNAGRRKRSYLSSTAQPPRRCQCPKHFSSWQSAAAPSHCRCDCHLSDLTCQRLKNGDEGFAMSDRRCILSNECSAPVCSFGVYSQHSGRCPRAAQQKQTHSGMQMRQRAHHGFG